MPAVPALTRGGSFSARPAHQHSTPTAATRQIASASRRGRVSSRLAGVMARSSVSWSQPDRFKAAAQRLQDATVKLAEAARTRRTC